MRAQAPAAFIIFGSITIASVLSSSPLILTPYILNNQTDLARNLSEVHSKDFLNVRSHSGFLTVDQKYNSSLFFWYFPVANKPLNTTPWIVWLQGGPGASSLAGLFLEMGPFIYEKGSLKLRESSWTKKYSMLFIDNPVGAGFSFSGSDSGFIQNMDDCSTHLYRALQQFLEIFPEVRSAPLYLAGESYAGHYVPALGHKILHPPPPSDLKIRNTTIYLKGLMMGNPVIDRKDEVNLTSVYYQWGLIDSQGVLAAKPLQVQYARAIQDGDYIKASESRNDLLDKIEARAYQQQSYNVLKDQIELSGFTEFLMSDSVRESIHVGHAAFDFASRSASRALKKDFLISLTTEVEELLQHCKVLIYCGQLDLTAPCVMNAEARREHWRWAGRQQFLNAPRNPWWHNGTVAGYVKKGGNFTEVLVRDAGHLVPMEKPFETLELITSFIEDQDLPLPPGYSTFASPPLVYENNAVYNLVSNSKGLVASILLNVLFVCVIVVGVIYAIRWKRRHDNYFYTMADNSSLNDGVLTMT